MQFRFRLILPHQLLCYKLGCINRKRHYVLLLLLLLLSLSITHTSYLALIHRVTTVLGSSIKCSLSKRKRRTTRTISSSLFIVLTCCLNGYVEKTNIPKITHPAVGNQSTVTENSNKTGNTEHTMEEKQISALFFQFQGTFNYL